MSSFQVYKSFGDTDVAVRLSKGEIVIKDELIDLLREPEVRQAIVTRSSPPLHTIGKTPLHEIGRGL
jgi:hypothetical protein